jgi:uncharacterized protein (DUF433 family)
MSKAGAVSREPWRARLKLPNYRIKEAARYTGISPRTVSLWHAPDQSSRQRTLSAKPDGVALSYLQLIEVAVVAEFRKAGITLAKIREAREYVSKQLRSEYPFADYKFKSDGRELWINYEEVEASSGSGKLLQVTKKGQLTWSDIIGRLDEFEYEPNGIVVSWHVAGISSPIIIDPRVAFGAPSVSGIPTWVIKGRWDAGEAIDEIADDFGIDEHLAKVAIDFERVETTLEK